MTALAGFFVSAFWVVWPLSLIALAFIVPWRLHTATVRLGHYETYSSVFFQKAQALVSDRDTPLEIIQMISFLNDRIDRRDGAQFIFGLLLRPMDRSAGDEVVREFHDTIEPFFAKRPELEKAYREAMANWVMALIANSKGAMGILVRQATKSSLWMLDEERVAKKVTADKRHRDAKGRSDRRNGGDHAYA